MEFIKAINHLNQKILHEPNTLCSVATDYNYIVKELEEIIDKKV